MSDMPSANSGCRILAVAVLYKQSPTESRALSSFIRILKDNPQMAIHFSLVVYDNSPQRHEVLADLPVHYVHDPANGGLAAAYNYALARAEQAGNEWLLLLDQDTTLTREFFSELIACTNTLQTQDNVAAIVPKLMAQGRLKSPAEDFIDYIRHQFTGSAHTLGQDVAGVQHGRISAYNSGSTMSVSLLRSIGGFPTEFWLDYLDHAVFHALCAMCSRHRRSSSNALETSGTGYSTGCGSYDLSGAFGPIATTSAFGKKRRCRPCSSAPQVPLPRCDRRHSPR